MPALSADQPDLTKNKRKYRPLKFQSIDGRSYLTDENDYDMPTPFQNPLTEFYDKLQVCSTELEFKAPEVEKNVQEYSFALLDLSKLSCMPQASERLEDGAHIRT